MAVRRRQSGWDTHTTAKGFRVYNRVSRKIQGLDRILCFSGGNVSSYNDVEDLDDQQFIVHCPSIAAVQDKHSEEYPADKEVPLSSEEQALHDELVSLMHQESLAKSHNDAQRNAFEKEKREIDLEKGKECVNSTFT
ncbi:hypothetical protein Tco_0710699 [Tanacetum coccineum]